MHFNSKFNRMTDNRMSGFAFFIGMTGTIITMALHPTSQDITGSANAGHMMQLNVAVHSLALVCMPILFLGALGLTAAASDLIAPGLFHHMAANPGMADTWRAILILNGHLNQAFATIFVVASSAAIVLWSAAMLRSGSFSRPLGISGCIVGPITVIAVLSGHIRLNVHGFGMVVLVQAIWFISAGVLLWKDDQPATQLTSA